MTIDVVDWNVRSDVLSIDWEPNLLCSQPHSTKTFEDATAAAMAECPELPWERIFRALRAAGVLEFRASGDR